MRIDKKKILAKIYATIFVYLGKYLMKIMGDKVIEGFYERTGERTAEAFKKELFRDIKIKKHDLITIDRILKTLAKINDMEARTYGYGKYTILGAVNYCPFANIIKKHKLHYICNFCVSVAKNIIKDFGYNLEVPEKITQGKNMCKFIAYSKREKVSYKGKGKKVKGYKVRRNLQLTLMKIALRELVKDIQNITGNVSSTLIKNGSYLAGKESGKEILKSIKIKDKEKVISLIISIVTGNLAKFEKGKIKVNKEKFLHELNNYIFCDLFKSWIKGVIEAANIKVSFEENEKYCYIKFNNNK